MRIGRAFDVKHLRTLELLRIAVGCPKPEIEVLPGFNLLICYDHIFLGNTRRSLDWRPEAQDLLQCIRDKGRIDLQLAQNLWVLSKTMHRVPYEVSRGFIACNKEQDAVGHQFPHC